MHGTIDGWSFPAGLTSALLVFGLVYERGWRRARRLAPAERHDHDRLGAAFPSPSSRRAGLFILGLSALWLALASPFEAIAHELLFMHMLQHVIVGAIAPPLIWLSEPILPVLLGLPRWLARRTHAALAFGALGPLGRFLTHPFTAWLAATLTLIGWHVPAAFESAQQSQSWHWIQNASFFATGLLFWWPVVQPWPADGRLPRPAVPLYLFAATLPCDALSAFLVFCDRVVYRLGGPRQFGITALADQQTAGALMWVSITLLYVVPAIVMTVHALSPAQKRPGGIGGRAH